MKRKEYQIRIRVWIDEKEGAFLGIGKVLLLENIKKTGSISNAAKNLKMSYRQAWQHVKDMNNIATSPLVDVKLGGAGGGGAFITLSGEKAIKLFYLIENNLNISAQKLVAKMNL